MNAWPEFLWVLVFFASVAGLLFDERFRLMLAALLAAAFAFAKHRNVVHMRAVDWVLVLIPILEIQDIGASQYRANSVRTALAIALFAATYCLVRLTIRSFIQVSCLSSLVALAGSWIVVMGLERFATNTETLRHVGFANLVAFRSRLFSPQYPWIPGVWFSLVLLTLPFACAMFVAAWQKGRRRLAAVGATSCLTIVTALTLSFSRAVFWSTVLFFVVLIVFMVYARYLRTRKGVLILASLLIALALVVFCESLWFPEISRAYIGNDTSQSRSAEGRIGIWRECLEVLKAHPISGIGSANSALFLNRATGSDETAAFASRTFSLPLQLLIERGLPGLALCTTFLVFVGRDFVLSLTPLFSSASDPQGKPNPDHCNSLMPMSCCFAAGIAAVASRELVYSSLFDHTLTLALVAILCGLIVNGRECVA